MSPLQRATKIWLKGLVAASITGAAGAIATSQVVAAMDPGTFNFGLGLNKMLWFLLFSAAIHAVIGAASYLQKSPLPEGDDK